MTLDYELPKENSVRLCDDTLDNDGDGAVDCADPDCWGLPAEPGSLVGACDEGSGGACDDGLDNDLDGRPDAFDLSCGRDAWAAQVRHCGSVAGTVIATLEDVRTEWTGDADVVSREGTVAIAVPAGGAANLTRVWTGALVGTELRMSVEVGHEAAAELRVLPESLDGVVSGDFYVRLVRTSGTGRLEVGVSRLGADAPPDVVALPAGAGDVVSLAITGDMERPGDLLVTVQEGAPPVRVRNDLSLGPAPPLRLRVASLSGTTRLAALDVFRPPFDPCAETVPPTGVPESGRIWTLTASDTTMCAVYEQGRGSFLLLAAERTPRSLPNISPPLPSFDVVGPWRIVGDLDLRDPIIAWDRSREAFVGAAVLYEAGAPTDHVWLVEAPSCAGPWEPLGEPRAEGETASWEFGGIGGGVVGYNVLPRSGVHQLHVGALFDGDRDGVSIWRSEDGAPGTFRRAQPPISALLGPRARAPWFLVAGMGEALRHAEVVGGASGVLQEVHARNPVTVLRPSGRLGTFDAAFVDQGLVWFPEPVAGEVWWGLFAYTARACPSCPTRFGLARVAPGGTERVFPDVVAPPR